MARVIVIDWGPQQVQLLEADARGSGATVRKLTTLELPGGPESAEADSGRRQLEQALASFSSGVKVIGLVGRSQAVLRDVRVPNAPPDELPGIVQFQAMRELSFPIEQAAIDFDTVGPPDDDGQRRVILSALQQDVVERYRSVLAASKLELSRLGLRPYATCRAYRQVAGTSDDCVLVVSLMGESLELTVMRGELVLFSRATLVRGPADSPAVDASMIVGEVRRTLAAFANQSAGVEVRRVAVAAHGDEHRVLLEALVGALPIPVDAFDPFRAVELTRSAGDVKQIRDGSAFVAAIGAALAADEPWPIDFLNPKKPVVRRDRRKPIAALGAAAVAVFVLAAWLFVHVKLSAGEQEISRLKSEQTKLQEKLTRGEDILRRYQAVEDWMKAETNCLEELRRLTEEYPDTKQMYTTAVAMGRENTPGALPKIELDGIAREQLAILDFNLRLNRAGRYSAQLTDRLVSSGSGPYRYTFKANLVAKPETNGQDKRAAKSKPAGSDDAPDAEKTGKADPPTGASPSEAPVKEAAGADGEKGGDKKS